MQSFCERHTANFYATYTLTHTKTIQYAQSDNILLVWNIYNQSEQPKSMHKILVYKY